MNNEDALRKTIVASVIGDIPQCISYEDDGDIEPLSDEEVAEIEALPPVVFTPEEEARLHASGMKVVRWILYKQAMQKHGLPHLDRHEFMNMAVEPVAPPWKGETNG